MKTRTDIQYKRPTREEIVENEEIIKDLLLKNYQSNFEYSGIPKKIIELDFQRLLTFVEDGSAILFLATLGDRPVGFLWAYIREVIGVNKLHLNHIVVEDEYKGIGVGKGLFRQLENYNRSDQSLVIELITSLSNEQAMRFYESLGFVQKRVLLEKSEAKNED